VAGETVASHTAPNNTPLAIAWRQLRPGTRVTHTTIATAGRKNIIIAGRVSADSPAAMPHQTTIRLSGFAARRANKYNVSATVKKYRFSLRSTPV
jgi:hypothetical protein